MSCQIQIYLTCDARKCEANGVIIVDKIAPSVKEIKRKANDREWLFISLHEIYCRNCKGVK